MVEIKVAAAANPSSFSEAFDPAAVPPEVERKLTAMSKQLFPGPNYLAWLDSFHRNLKPKNYLEIGISKGVSMARVSRETPSIGIDPAFHINNTIESPCRLYRETSDDFFARRDPAEIFGGPIDFAFIDGLHTFEQTFRDIVNVAKSCDNDSLVVVHDVLPVHEVVARRNRVTSFWTGDVWKIGPMIKELMPNVIMITLMTYPSGLMVLKNLKGAHEIDAKRWAEVEARWMAEPHPKDNNVLADLVKARKTDEENFWRLFGRKQAA